MSDHPVDVVKHYLGRSDDADTPEEARIRASCDERVVYFEGLPMPNRAEFVYPDGRVEPVEGVVCRDGETFSTAVEREARERGAAARFRAPK